MKVFVKIILVLFVFLIFILNMVFPILNESYARIYLSLFKKDQLLAVNESVGFDVPSKVKPYIVFSSLVGSIGLINSSNDEIKIISKQGTPLSSYPFSPSGDKLIYSQVHDGMGIGGTDGSTTVFNYYYDLFIYDIKTGISEKITNKDSGQLYNNFANYAGEIYGWIDNNTIAYNCDLERIADPKKTCIYDLDKKTTKLNFESAKEALFNANANTNITNIPVGADYTVDGCFYDFSRKNCVYSDLKIHVWDGMAFQELWLKKPNTELLLYRNKTRVQSMYWTSDGHLYGFFSYQLYKLY
jgi:hypothetical protein